MRCILFAATVAAALGLADVSVSAPLFVDNFDVDPTPNWTINSGPSDEAANFFFDYNSVGIPPAPNSLGGSTRGMKLQANLTDGTFGGFSVSPTGQGFSGDYVLKFDWWANANGPFPAGGSGSTNLSTFGIGTAGATAQWPGGTQDSLWFGATGEGGSSVDWRAYSPAAGTGYTPASGVFAAGTSEAPDPDSRNSGDPYYAGFGGATAPAAQVALFSQQSGATQAGAAGMTWHEVEIAKQGDIVTWTVGGTLIATVDVTSVTLGGGNIHFGHSDINATSSTDANDVDLLFTLIDNVTVTQIPEPSSFALGVLAIVGLLGARRRN